MRKQGKVKLAREIAARSPARIVHVQSEPRVRRAPKYITRYLKRAMQNVVAVKGDVTQLLDAEWELQRVIDWAEGR